MQSRAPSTGQTATPHLWNDKEVLLLDLANLIQSIKEGAISDSVHIELPIFFNNFKLSHHWAKRITDSKIIIHSWKNKAPESSRCHRFICHWKGSDKQNEFPDTHRRTHEFIQGLKITSSSVKNQSSSTYRASPGYLAHPPHVRNNKISNLHTPIEKQISRKNVTCMYIKSFLEAPVLFDPPTTNPFPQTKNKPDTI